MTAHLSVRNELRTLRPDAFLFFSCVLRAGQLSDVVPDADRPRASSIIISTRTDGLALAVRPHSDASWPGGSGAPATHCTSPVGRRLSLHPCSISTYLATVWSTLLINFPVYLGDLVSLCRFLVHSHQKLRLRRERERESA